MPIGKIVLKRPAQKYSRAGHPWIYRSQIESVSRDAVPGDLVAVVDHNRHFTGSGYWNPKSEISVRLLTTSREEIDKDFFKKKIEKALLMRTRFVKDTNAMRIISSEADGLPGLVIDQYGEVLVAQFLTLGMDRLRPRVFEALAEALPSRSLYERSDSSSRRIEGLQEKTGWVTQTCGDEVTLFEKGVRFRVNFGQGHKTGFYLDQRENRLFLAELGLKGEVLDAFCYTGGFGLHLAAGGCKVLGLDSQEEVIAAGRENCKLNGLDETQIELRAANVFDELRVLEKAKRKFDLVILDPPSFAKKKDALEGALAGYREIILRSLKVLNEGGLLAVFSCSYHLDENLLMQVSQAAAVDARKSLRVIKFFRQSLDHPIDPFIPETFYLKGYLFYVS